MTTTLLSFPERGPFGDRNYRGNCSGYLGRVLAEWLRPKTAWDPMAGSGSVVEALQASGVDVVGTDLRSGVDLLSADDDLPLPVGRDLVFLHPAYWDIISYVPGDPRDLGFRGRPYDQFIGMLNQAAERAFDAVRSGGHLAVLVGDVARDRRIYPIFRDMKWLGIPLRVFIKEQHNTTVDTYAPRVVKIVHEYLLVTEKPRAIAVPVRTTSWQWSDPRRRADIPWRALVAAALDALGGQATLPEIYEWLASAAKTAARPHWREKVRQILQITPQFRAVERGTWRLAAA